MEEKNSLRSAVVGLVIIISVLLIITGAVFFYSAKAKCSARCDKITCKYSVCRFKMNSFKFECEYNIIGFCCGNGYCEKGETQCNCAYDCRACAGIAGLCLEYACDSNKTCSTIPLRNCCGNNICELGETYERCPQDCIIKNQTFSSYEGPRFFNKNECNEISFAECPYGKYDGFEQSHHLKLSYFLGGYGFSAGKRLASFYFYAKKSPTGSADGKSTIITVKINGNLAGNKIIEHTSWENQDYGFKWYDIYFPVTFLKPGENVFEFSSNNWFALGKYNNSYMTYLKLESELN